MATTSADYRFFYAALGEIDELDRFAQLCHSGLAFGTQAERMRDLADRLRARESPPPAPLSTEEVRRRAEETAKLQRYAQDQQEQGFPQLWAFAAIRLWGILEVALDDLAVGRLRSMSPETATQVVSGIRGPLLEFASASPDDQADILTAELKRETKASLQRGLARFEVVLSALNLGGGAHESVRRTLLELQAVRNNLTHRSATIDKRLAAQCPWLDLRIGEKLRLTPRHFQRYRVAASWYLAELARRVDPKAPEAPDLERLLDELVEQLDPTAPRGSS
jgi:hypothetical protein